MKDDLDVAPSRLIIVHRLITACGRRFQRTRQTMPLSSEEFWWLVGGSHSPPVLRQPVEIRLVLPPAFYLELSGFQFTFGTVMGSRGRTQETRQVALVDPLPPEFADWLYRRWREWRRLTLAREIIAQVINRCDSVAMIGAMLPGAAPFLDEPYRSEIMQGVGCAPPDWHHWRTEYTARDGGRFAIANATLVARLNILLADAMLLNHPSGERLSSVALHHISYTAGSVMMEKVNWIIFAEDLWPAGGAGQDQPTD